MTSLSEQRRAIGADMVRQRTGQSTVDSLNRLTTKQRERKALRTLDPLGAVDARRGSADWVQGRPNSTGTGVAWPLTEQDYSQREYHENALMTSDGIFFIPAVAKIVLTDADGKPGTVFLAEPE